MVTLFCLVITITLRRHAMFHCHTLTLAAAIAGSVIWFTPEPFHIKSCIWRRRRHCRHVAAMSFTLKIVDSIRLRAAICCHAPFKTYRRLRLPWRRSTLSPRHLPTRHYCRCWHTSLRRLLGFIVYGALRRLSLRLLSYLFIIFTP